MSLLDVALVASRSLQYVGAALLGGGSAFFVYGCRGEVPWRARLVGLGAVLGGVGALGWIMAQAGQLGDGPTAAFDLATIRDVATGTSFGRVALGRAVVFIVALIGILTVAGVRKWVVAGALGLIVAGSFAWTGHGTTNGGWPHLVADMVHLAAATIWLGALAALVGLAATGDQAILHQGLAAFSKIGIAVVAALVVSGFVNSWYLVGPEGIGQLSASLYGQVLMAKLAAFGAMLGCAAWNRHRHTPTLARSSSGFSQGVKAARRTLVLEAMLGAAVIIAIAWMGALAPIVE